MKDVIKKDLPEVSGGEFPLDGCIPYPRFPGTEGESYPQPKIPVYEPTALPDA